MDVSKMIAGLLFLTPFLYILYRDFSNIFGIIKTVLGIFVGIYLGLLALLGLILFFTGLIE